MRYGLIVLSIGAMLFSLSSCEEPAKITILGNGFFSPVYEGPPVKVAKPLTRFRGKSRMILFAEQDAKVTLHLTNSQVSSRYKDDLRFDVKSPDGKSVAKGKLPVKKSKDVTFTAPKAGLYEIRIDARGNATQLTADGARLCIPATDDEPCAVIQGSQPLYFYVPAGSRRFRALFRGAGTGETAEGVVFNPDGREVKRGSTVGSNKVLLDVPVGWGQAGRVWSLQIQRAKEGVFEDASVSLLGNVGPNVAQRPDAVVVPLMRVAMPGMRRTFEKAKLEIRGAVLAPVQGIAKPSLSVTAASGGKEIFAKTITNLRSGAFCVNLPRNKFPKGSYTLRVAAKDGEKVLSSREQEMFVVDRPTGLRPDKVTLHNGKPFFARGLYHVKPEDYDLVKKQGFNIVQATPDSVPKCEKAGISAAVALYAGMRLNPDYYREKIAAYRTSPAVVCWMIMDEPSGNKVPLSDIQRHYGIIRDMDPARPAYMCICRPDAYTTYGMATDIIAIDVYPVREKNQDLAHIARTLDLARRDVPGQTVWFIGQVWSWPGRENPKQRRLVTAAEHRCMTYLSLTHDDVRGLMWYSFRDPDWYLPKSNPEVWAACKTVNNELIALEPVLLQPNRYEKVLRGSGDAEVHLAMKEHDGHQTLIAVNPNNKATDVTIPVSGSGEAEVMFEKRKVKIEGGAIRDKFGALAVHIYRMKK
ncbi:MAG: hypothetical protein GXP25_12055 [Planctomycetes bacterium]|nr:hypothetical protein [Planctomycetota bacterium]